MYREGISIFAFLRPIHAGRFTRSGFVTDGRQFEAAGLIAPAGMLAIPVSWSQKLQDVPVLGLLHGALLTAIVNISKLPR